MARPNSSVELRGDPVSLAPERVIVFEVNGSVAGFASAIRRVTGFEFLDEEELDVEGQGPKPVAYLLLPDERALRELLSLWRRWLDGRLVNGETPWRRVFETLRDLRVWGPQDRVQDADIPYFTDLLSQIGVDGLARIEVELIYRTSVAASVAAEQEVRRYIENRGGEVVSVCRIGEIAYHSLLCDVPADVMSAIVERRLDGIAGVDPVMAIRPQSLATGVDVENFLPLDEFREHDEIAGDPIAALLDGVPVAAHALLEAHADVEDYFDLEQTTPVNDRRHGTAMLSLIVHGDLNRPDGVLPRKVCCVPVLGAGEGFPNNRLIIDLIYEAIVRMVGGDNPSRPGVLIVNLSLGNRCLPFSGRVSAWARLLDYLSYRYGLLFLVSAGNCLTPFAVDGFARQIDFEEIDADARARAAISGVGAVMADRRLISPAEAINSITVGGANVDAVSQAQRELARGQLDLFLNVTISNPSSSLGPGFANSVKPDILMPAGKEFVRARVQDGALRFSPSPPAIFGGLKVAAPPQGGVEGRLGYTNGTSAATALATRACHRIYDALENAYADAFLRLPKIGKAVLLKALLAHGAKWPSSAASLIKEVIGPNNNRQSVRQKDNIRRFLGYGLADVDVSLSCVDDRATFWCVGSLGPDLRTKVDVPLPVSISGRALPHEVRATLAWFTPTSPGRRTYRAVRLKLLEPNDLGGLGVAPSGEQPDLNQSNRGTLFSRTWAGDRAPVVAGAQILQLIVQREPDQGDEIDDAVPFALAVTLSMPGVNELYEEVRARVGAVVRV